MKRSAWRVAKELPQGDGTMLLYPRSRVSDNAVQCISGEAQHSLSYTVLPQRQRPHERDISRDV